MQLPHTKSNLIAITIFYDFSYYYLLQNCAALFYVYIHDIDPEGWLDEGWMYGYLFIQTIQIK